MRDSSDWCTIESDPGVFTELIQSFGVKGVQVEEVYDLENGLYSLDPVLGLIFLFKWQPDQGVSPHPIIETPSEDVFFAQQVISNACATQAILSVLLNLNSKDKEIDIGNELENFHSFAKDLPYDLRGLAIANCETIRQSHNSFNRPEPFVMDQSDSSKDSDAFHFISYIPIGGKLYELDGLKKGPVLLCDMSDSTGTANSTNWIDHIIPIITERISKYQQTEIRFNLLAIVKNRKDVLEGKRGVLLGERDAMKERGCSEEDMALLNSTIGEIEMGMDMEDRKLERYRIENERRRFNYIPFVFEFLKTLSRKGKLEGLVDQSNCNSGSRN